MKIAPLVGTFLVGLLLGWLIFKGRSVSPVVLHEIDSVLVAGPAVRDTIKVAVQASAVLIHKARDATARADSLSRVADSLASVAADTGRAYLAEREANTTLRQANDTLLRATQLLTAGLATASTRITTLETTLRLSRNELNKTKRPSRWAITAGPGYAAVLDGGAISHGPGASVNVSYRLF